MIETQWAFVAAIADAVGEVVFNTNDVTDTNLVAINAGAKLGMRP